jgi:hypothetical protein
VLMLVKEVQQGIFAGRLGSLGGVDSNVYHFVLVAEDSRFACLFGHYFGFPTSNMRLRR